MSRLPTVGQDAGNWGDILNNYLSQSHTPDGSLRADVANIADLKALDVTQIRDKMQALVGGYYAHGDGGGGQFYYDQAASDADNGGTIIAPTAGSGRWKRIFHKIFYPQWFGAKGNGVTDDSLAIQACIAAAEGTPHATVMLLPAISFGIGTTIDFGGGTHDTLFVGGSFSVNSPSNYTFTKLANVTAWRVVSLATCHPKIQGISVKGRGDDSPALTNPSLDNTPGALIHSKCTVRDVFFSNTGGVISGNPEPNTTGYALGIYQFTGGNTNYVELDGLSVVKCKGDGLYVGRQSGSVLNCNAIQARVRQYLQSSGYAVNASSGVRCDYYVRHCAPGVENMSGVFQILYVENSAYCQYAEGGTALLVTFGTTGGRNRVSCNDASAFTTICPDYRDNTVVDYQSGNTFVGNNAGGHQQAFYGSAGVALDALRLPSVTAGTYSAITSASAADYGTSWDLYAGSTVGYVTWTSRAAITSRIGRLVGVAMHLAGSLGTASAANGRLKIDRTVIGISLENQSNLGVLGPLHLVNSSGTMLVYLRPSSVEYLQIVDGTGADMSFNSVVGTGSFTLSGMIMLLATSGQN